MFNDPGLLKRVVADLFAGIASRDSYGGRLRIIQRVHKSLGFWSYYCPDRSTPARMEVRSYISPNVSQYCPHITQSNSIFGPRTGQRQLLNKYP